MNLSSLASWTLHTAWRFKNNDINKNKQNMRLYVSGTDVRLN
jgi:hypothetical protein